LLPRHVQEGGAVNLSELVAEGLESCTNSGRLLGIQLARTELWRHFNKNPESSLYDFVRSYDDAMFWLMTDKSPALVDAEPKAVEETETTEGEKP
jgi:hypothetical protein